MEKSKSELPLKLLMLSSIPVHLIFGSLLTHVGLPLVSYTKLIKALPPPVSLKMELISKLLTDQVVSKDS